MKHGNVPKDKQPWNQTQSLALEVWGDHVPGSASDIYSVRMVKLTHRPSQPSLWHWSSAVPTAEHRLPSTCWLSGERQQTLPRTLALQLLHAELHYLSPTLLLTWECASWHLFFFLQTVSPLTVLYTSGCHTRGDTRASSWTSPQGTSPAIFLWPCPIVVCPGRAASYGSTMEHSFPSRINSPLLSRRFPLSYCCDTLPSFWCEVAFHSFLWNLGLLQFMPWLKMCCRVKHIIQGRVLC